MNTNTKSPARRLARASDRPDLEALQTELAEVMTQSGSILTRQRVAIELRHNIWDGQSEDYRRHEDDIGKRPAPFEGAPDERVPVVDIVIRERVALYMTAVMDSDIQAKPIAGLDNAASAEKASRSLRWLRSNVLQGELRSEAELLANYVEGDDPGIGVLKIWWKREAALEMRELDMETVSRMLLTAMGVPLDDNGEAPPEYSGHMMEAADLLTNKEREETAIDWMKQPGVFPTVSDRQMRRALRELRSTGQTKLPAPYVKDNRPCVEAKRFMHEVFFRAEYDDIQRARMVFEREFLTEAELRARAIGVQWDKDWIEDVIEQGPGPQSWGVGNNVLGNVMGLMPPGLRGMNDEANQLYEVWTAYTRAADEYGIPGVYWTVFSLSVKDDFGYHGLLDYPHGDYPFILFRSEHTGRGVENVRSVPPRAGSRQAAIKLQRDSRGAATMLSTVPPYTYRQRMGGVDIVFGPLAGNPVKDPEDIKLMQMPGFPQSSVEMEKAAWDDLNQLYGRPNEGVTNQLGDAILKMDVGRWLDAWQEAWSQILELQQAYGDPVQMSAVEGEPHQPISRDEIRGRFTIQLAFSTRDLNMEFVIKKIDAMQKAMALDLKGQADWNAAFKAVIRGIDPSLAETILQDPQAVTRQQIDDQQGRVSKMAAGIEPPAMEGPSNAKLRFQTLQETVASSPVLARRYHQPANADDELFKELVDNEGKNLGFLNTQFTVNPTVGRTGVKPVLNGGGPGA